MEQPGTVPTEFVEDGYDDDGGNWWTDEDKSYDREYSIQEKFVRRIIYWFHTGTIIFFAIGYDWIDDFDAGALDHKFVWMEYIYHFLVLFFMAFLASLLWNWNKIPFNNESFTIWLTARKFDAGDRDITQSVHQEHIKKMRAKNMYR